MQCDEDPLLQENREQRQEVGRLREELGRHKWGVECNKDNDKFLHRITLFCHLCVAFQVRNNIYKYVLQQCALNETNCNVRISTSIHVLDYMYFLVILITDYIYTFYLATR